MDTDITSPGLVVAAASQPGGLAPSYQTGPSNSAPASPPPQNVPAPPPAPWHPAQPQADGPVRSRRAEAQEPSAAPRPPASPDQAPRVPAPQTQPKQSAPEPRVKAAPTKRAPSAEQTAQATSVIDRVARVIQGGRDVAQLAVIAMLAEGHILIEDVPGVGKTTLARALAAAIGAEAGRIQFTPDMLPGDVVGMTIYRPGDGRLDFVPGPVFHSVVIADEINRASPKTQSALLEAMQDASVTVDGVTHPLPNPFIVMATQNPIEMDGTYALPEAQRDRFMVRLAMGYPEYASEVALLDAQEFTDPLEDITAVVTLGDVRELIGAARSIYTAPQVKQYIVDLATATRTHPGTVLGVSPRASLQLLRAAKAAALVAGRGFVLPDDVQWMLPHVWAHRLIQAHHTHLTAADERAFVVDLMRHVPVR